MVYCRPLTKNVIEISRKVSEITHADTPPPPALPNAFTLNVLCEELYERKVTTKLSQCLLPYQNVQFNFIAFFRIDVCCLLRSATKTDNYICY
jgi:hypothetical protein